MWCCANETIMSLSLAWREPLMSCLEANRWWCVDMERWGWHIQTSSHPILSPEISQVKSHWEYNESTCGWNEKIWCKIIVSCIWRHISKQGQGLCKCLHMIQYWKVILNFINTEQVTRELCAHRITLMTVTLLLILLLISGLHLTIISSDGLGNNLNHWLIIITVADYLSVNQLNIAAFNYLYITRQHSLQSSPWTWSISINFKMNKHVKPKPICSWIIVATFNGRPIQL